MGTLIDGERLPLKKAAERFGFHANTLYRWSRVGHGGRKLRLIRFGGRTFVRLEDMEAFVRELSDPAPRKDVESEQEFQASNASAYLDSQGL